MTEDQKIIIAGSSAGIIGGGAKLLNTYNPLLRKNHFQFIRSAENDADFNILIVRTDKLQVPHMRDPLTKGIYYGYGNIFTDGSYDRFKGYK